MERLGIKLVVSPRNAGVILFTGPITQESLPKVIKAIRAIPGPGLVLALGFCTVGGGIWYDTYAMLGGFERLKEMLKSSNVEVDRVVYVPGCPVRLEAIIHGMLVLLGLRR